MTTDVNSPLKGIAYKVFHIFLVSVMLTLIKLVEGMPITELVFFRSLFAVVPLALWLAWRGRFMETARTKRPFGHLTRATLSLLTMSMTFLAVRSLPLPEAVTLQYTQPLFVVALSAILLGERVRAFRWFAVAIGFMGALVITWPKLTLLTSGAPVLSQDELIGASAALTAAASLAFTLIWLRQLVRTESSLTIALWLGFYASAVLLLTIPFGWVVPNMKQMGQLILIGLLGIAVQITLSETLRFAPASTTAPFEYSSLIFATILGIAVFGDIPDANTLIGGGILVAAGLMILWRERSMARRPSTVRATGVPSE